MTMQTIQRAAVIGSGTMGSSIAALLASVGVPVVLLDLPAPQTQPGDTPAARNALILANLERLKTTRPPALAVESDLERITVGNTEDDLALVADADWIIEVIIEQLEAKQALMRALAAHARPDAIISTNTSGIPLRLIAAEQPDTFKRRFLGTHFFNPPRHLRLLEVIPHDGTAAETLALISRFASERLDKGVVLCKDTPNFIGNRLLSLTAAHTLAYTLDHGFTIDEVDALTGTLIGRPKTASFRLQDLIGIDVLVYMARNLYPAISDDSARDLLQHDGANALYAALMERGWLGNKRGQGFYKAVKADDGMRTFYTLDLKTLDYQPAAEPQFESVARHADVHDTAERIRRIVAEDDRAARFLWHHHAFYLTYAAARVPEIAESPVSIDNAQAWGFGHALGPFALWDALGVPATVETFEGAGYPVAAWVKTLLADGHTTFYQRDADGQAVAVYTPSARGYVPLVQTTP